ncbi:MAG: LacI family DNA-binding transcriptional regulator [Victivallales bacterium]|nr:LacI family DNA-binding transcriptional regulator [Victivallales bacterium]
MATITQIAEEAEVSISTVSRYFNNPGKVQPRTAERIQRVVTRHNFELDIRRPGPKTLERVGIHSGVVVFLFLGKIQPDKLFSYPAILQLFGSIQAEVNRRGLSLIMTNLQENGKLPACIDPKLCDGLILFGKPDEHKVMKQLHRVFETIPAVWCFREHCDDNGETDHVFYDNEVVGRLAADYLASRNHKRVAVFNPDAEHTAFSTRVARFAEKAIELRMQSDLLVLPRETTPVTAGYGLLADKYLSICDEVPAAFFCSDDTMLGIWNELRARGVDMRKLDFIGVNADEIILRFMDPRPATIDIKMSQVGEMTVDLLLNRINGVSSDYRSEISIKPELVPGKKYNEDKDARILKQMIP